MPYGQRRKKVTKKKVVKKKVAKKTVKKKKAKKVTRKVINKKVKKTAETNEKTEAQPEVKAPVALGDHTITLGFIARISLFLICLVALVYNFHLIKEFSNIPKYDSITLPVVITWPLIGAYVLLSLAFICFAALLKKGFKNLKPLKEEGG